jgi:hypothetical protein
MPTTVGRERGLSSIPQPGESGGEKELDFRCNAKKAQRLTTNTLILHLKVTRKQNKFIQQLANIRRVEPSATSLIDRSLRRNNDVIFALQDESIDRVFLIRAWQGFDADADVGDEEGWLREG